MNIYKFRHTTILFVVIAFGVTSCQITPATNAPQSSMPVTVDKAPMVYIPAGEFVMGSTILNEQPAHKIRLGDFWMDQYELTNVLYKRCVEAGICSPPASHRSAKYSTYYGDPAYDNFPVNQVSWFDAEKYCHWAGKRLPTEAEWEKTARGTDGRSFPWGNTWDERRLNSLLSGLYDATAVGSYPDGASPYGALDMSGNVWEWVTDWYAEDYYAQSPIENPRGPNTGDSKVVRGGGYGVYDAAMRTTARREITPDTRATYLGFRCAK